MSDTDVLDKTFHFIIKQMVMTGQAPHYTEIAAELGVAPEQGRQTMHTLFKSGISQLEGLLTMFSSNLFKRRLDPDYFSNMKNYIGELIGEIGGIDNIGIYMKS